MATDVLVGPPRIGALGLLLLLLLLVLWFVAASSAALKGDPIAMPNRIAQLYGYTACLVSLIVALVSTNSILNAAFDRAHPLQADYGFGMSLSSFESYRASAQLQGPMRPSEAPVQDTTSEAGQRQRYDAIVTDRRAANEYRTSKTLVTSGALLSIAVLLFLLHWRWVRRMGGLAPATVS